MDFKNIIFVESRPCPWCGKKTRVAADEKDYMSWKNGELIQRAFPYLSAAKRESLITGFCEECQKKIWDFEEKEDYE